MPRLRRRAKNRSQDYTANQRVLALLLTGHDWGFLDATISETYFSHPRTEILRDAWDEIGEQIIRTHVFGEPLANYSDEHRQHDARPGTRPHGFWMFAKEQRRLIEGTESPEAGKPYKHAMHGYIWTDGRLYSHGIPHWSDRNAIYESEFDYLERKRLFLPGEKALCHD